MCHRLTLAIGRRGRRRPWPAASSSRRGRRRSVPAAPAWRASSSWRRAGPSARPSSRSARPPADHLVLVVRGDGLLQVLVQLEDLHLVDVLGHLGVDVAVARRRCRSSPAGSAGALALAGARVVGDLELGDDVLAVGPLRQAQVEDVARRLVVLQRAQLRRPGGVPPARSTSSSLISGTTWRTRLILMSFIGRRCISTLRKPAAARLSNSSTKMRSAAALLVDVDVVPLALAELGQVLDQAGLPVGADAHQRQVDLLLGGLAGPAGGRSARRRFRRRSGPRPATAGRAGGCFSTSSRPRRMPSSIAVPPGSTSNMSILSMTSSILAFSEILVGGSSTRALWAKATMRQGVVGLELVDGATGGVLDAFEAADAGAVLLVHGAGDVEHQGQVEAQRLAGAALAGGDQLDQRVAGGGLAGDRDAVAVHHAFDVDLGRHACTFFYRLDEVNPR